MHGLSQRDLQPELMDDPSIDSVAHISALQGLRRVNRLSRTAQVLWRAIQHCALFDPEKPLRILDVACGGGDVAIDLARIAMDAGRAVEVVGCDISATAIAHARQTAERRRTPAQFEVRNVLLDPLPENFDVIYCSLFLHHLEMEDVETLLRKMSAAARQLVMASDLRRSLVGFLFAWVGTRLLSRSPVVHTDGPLSVRAAFSLQELQELCIRSGLPSARVVRCWPQRMLMTWNSRTT